MPNTPFPPEQWLAQVIARLQSMGLAATTGSTSYIVDPTIVSPSASAPNARVIIGDVTHDNFGNSTGLPAARRTKWGIAVWDSTTPAWVQL